jgi:hypothetical protein
LAGSEDGGKAILKLLVDTAEFAGHLEFESSVAKPGEDKQENDAMPELERPLDGSRHHHFSMQ